MQHGSRMRGWLVAVVATLAIAGCSDDDGDATPPDGAPSPDDVTFREAFPDLPPVERPVDLVEVPGHDRFFLLAQEGLVLSFPKDETASEFAEALDWREQSEFVGGEQGLLGLEFSPRFASDGHVFVHYIAAEGTRRNVLSRFETSGAGAELRIEPDSETVILEVAQPYVNHNGGQVRFGPDGMLYVSLGDGGGSGDPDGQGQDPGTLFGSILRIDVSSGTQDRPYAIPDDNPFVDDPDVRDEVWAYGFRNPWRFSFDPGTDVLWAADVGEQAWEEVNVVEPGGNYGWSVMEGFECFNTDECDRDGLSEPLLAYPNEGDECSITGGHVVRGEAAGELDGYYVYGDFCSGRVWAVAADAADGDEPQPVQLRAEGPPIPSIAKDLDGQLYLVSFEGPIFRIEG